MESVFTDIDSPFYEFAIKYNLDPIPDDDLSVFIRNKFESSHLKIDEQVLQDIIVRSEGHPHFTQYYASVVFD